MEIAARYCSNTFPGPTVTAFGSHELRVFFRSDHEGTGNGFKALYKIRKAFIEEIPTRGRKKAWVILPFFLIFRFMDLWDQIFWLCEKHQLLLAAASKWVAATARHCGQRIARTDAVTSGWLVSPGYPIKYNKDLICDWEITVRPDHQVNKI